MSSDGRVGATRFNFLQKPTGKSKLTVTTLAFFPQRSQPALLAQPIRTKAAAFALLRLKVELLLRKTPAPNLHQRQVRFSPCSIKVYQLVTGRQ